MFVGMTIFVRLKRGNSMNFGKYQGCGIVGYAVGKGGRIPGAEEGPKSLRSQNLLERIQPLVEEVFDFGDVVGDVARDLTLSPSELLVNNGRTVLSACASLHEKVRTVMGQSLFPLILGGDHSVSIGSVSGLVTGMKARGGEAGLLWIDTHPDIHTPETSVFKNIHGMSVSFLLGLVEGGNTTFLPQGALKPEQIVYIGLREVDGAEREIIRRLGIKCFTMKEIDIFGMGKVVQEAILSACQNADGFVASFDLDVCDPSLVPGTGTPKRGGITFREAHLAMELIADSGKLLGLEVVELNPSLDQNNTTAELGVSLIESALGKSIL
jgi:arginase